MPVFLFERSVGDVVEVHVTDGARLLDVCDAHDAAEPLVPFSCRSASCGTCRVAVLEGADLLEPADDEETDVLEAFGADPAVQRLACQARLRPGRSGRVRVKVTE